MSDRPYSVNKFLESVGDTVLRDALKNAKTKSTTTVPVIQGETLIFLDEVIDEVDTSTEGESG